MRTMPRACSMSRPGLDARSLIVTTDMRSVRAGAAFRSPPVQVYCPRIVLIGNVADSSGGGIITARARWR